LSPTRSRASASKRHARTEFQLVAVHEELDISGGKVLDERPGLSAAVAAVETREAEVVAGPYFDRLFRSLTTQAGTVDRIERAESGSTPSTSER
jgi:hypothetical protein